MGRRCNEALLNQRNAWAQQARLAPGRHAPQDGRHASYDRKGAMPHPYNQEYSTERHYFDDEPFELLMPNYVGEVLLICSAYDRFWLEEDGRIEEQLYQEYVSLGLRRYPPRFTEARSAEDALDVLQSRRFDLIITMLDYSAGQTIELCRAIRQAHPHTPLVLLTRMSRDLQQHLDAQQRGVVDRVFSWLGDANLLLAIIKLVEDRLNAPPDVEQGDVQTIILVEDSVRYYSSYLPLIYRTVFTQANEQMAEGLNDHLASLRMRGRPKILLAHNFEVAVDLYERYRHNLLGVISDIKYRRNGVEDPRAGLALCARIRAQDPEMPLLLQSSQLEHREFARRQNAQFFYKHSTTLLNDLKTYIRDNYGFGDFVFRVPGSLLEVDRASNLAELQRKLKTVPADSIRYHVTNHHFSKWLKARALYMLAHVLRPKTMADFDSVESIRLFLIDTINNYRMHAGRGVIARFERDKFDDYSVLQRIGSGALGGKARGIAFINTFLKKDRIMFRFDGISVQIPKTVVMATDVFERFMETNRLLDVALSDREDAYILECFLAATLPPDVLSDLEAVVRVVKGPLAVRSSSLLEDSYMQPFAGVYSTYFTPNSNANPAVRLSHLCDAIKGVYASTYFKGSKAYAQATQSLIDEEKMAVLIQEVTGVRHKNLFYPSFSGVARSLNFYPIGRETAQEGVANVALGMGKTIVDGGVSLRFSPPHPKQVLQLSNTEMALKTTQQKFYAINLDDSAFRVTTDEAASLILVDVQEAAGEASVRQVLSTLDFQNNVLREDPNMRGRKVVTFAPILKYGMFPLAEILEDLLKVGAKQMNGPVEIEFAAELSPGPGKPLEFKFLQIRHIVDGSENESVDTGNLKAKDAIVLADTALGNGMYPDLLDMVYVRPQTFNPANTRQIVESLDRINRGMAAEEHGYVLVGPGRWGSSDPWLGVPVKWSHITQARVIVESGLKDFQVEPSQGSHFFQNLTSLHVAYLTINPTFHEGVFDVAFLDAQPAQYEDDFVRHVRFASPIVAMVNGRATSGVKAAVLKPGVPRPGAKPA